MFRIFILFTCLLISFNEIILSENEEIPNYSEKGYEVAIFGAGCFWKVEYRFEKVPGVISTMVGYSGGWLENPTYQQVCTGTTEHAEVVRIEYDPQQISYTELLEIFWEVHDPTQYNRQGWDVGRQYRSVIFYLNDEQLEQALNSKELAQNNYSLPIMTEIKPAFPFYKAEEYHQHYAETHSKFGFLKAKIPNFE